MPGTRAGIAARRGLSVLFVAVMALGTGAPTRAEESPIVIGTGPVAGNYFPAGGAICSVFNKANESDGPRCLVQATSGSEDNLNLLRAGQIEFALVQSDWQYLALHGGYGVNSATIPELRAVLSLHAQAITVVVHPDAQISALEDLKGRKVNLGPIGSAMRAMAEGLFSALGWSRGDFEQIAEVRVDQAAAGLCAGQFDAFILPASHPDAVVAAAANLCGAKIVGLPNKLIKQLSAEWSFYAPVEIPAGTYPGQSEAVGSYGVRAVLLTLSSVPEARVFALARAVFADLDALAGQLPVLGSLTREEMIRSGLVAEVHEGARRYIQALSKE
jgi:TRAP transporter TAXI family solute receptor